MLLSASSEFLALCRSQVTLVTQGLGACFSVIYLTENIEEMTEAGAKLIPVAAHPETIRDWDNANFLEAHSATEDFSPPLPLFFPESSSSEQQTTQAALQKLISQPGNTLQASEANQHWPKQQYQVILPLVYEDVATGLLVAVREDRPWSDGEHTQIEQIAKTLAIACMLDQRYQWFEQSHQQQQFRERQQEVLDDLLHQFRNPLTALRTFGKLLLKRLLPEDENRDVATGIVRESDRLQDLLQKIQQVVQWGDPDLAAQESMPTSVFRSPDPIALPAARQNETSTTHLLPEKTSASLPTGNGGLGSTPLRLAPCHVAPVLAPLITTASIIAQERGILLKSAIPSGLPPVCADTEALQEVLSNLIDNALKYTPSGGKVFVHAGLEQQSVSGSLQGIAISDTGPRIPPDDLEHIFERHYRGSQAGTQIPGTGLGLAIARDLVNQMQGTIEVLQPLEPEQSEQPVCPFDDSGFETTTKTFMVWLPVYA